MKAERGSTTGAEEVTAGAWLACAALSAEGVAKEEEDK